MPRSTDQSGSVRESNGESRGAPKGGWSEQVLARPYRCPHCGYPITWMPPTDPEWRCKNCAPVTFTVVSSAPGSGVQDGQEIALTKDDYYVVEPSPEG